MQTKTKKYYSGVRQEMLPFIPKDAKKILEVGCGVGGFAAQLLREDREIWGIEPFEEAFKQAESKLDKVINKAVEEAIDELPDDFFDVIIFNDVLEHLLHPKDVLIALKAKLSKTGCIVTSIPNVRFIKNLYHVLLQKDWKYADSGILDYTHLRFFTKKSMISLFSDAGYKIETLSGIKKTKLLRFLILKYALTLMFMSSQEDTSYSQYAIVAYKN